MVFLGDDADVDTGTTGGERFFTDTTNREDTAAQGDFAGEADIGTDGALGEGGDEGEGHGGAGRGAVFGDGASGDMEMDIKLFKTFGGDEEAVGLTAGIAEGGLGAFLHNVTHLAGES